MWLSRWPVMFFGRVIDIVWTMEGAKASEDFKTRFL